MNAGIKVYNNARQVLIDSNYANLALIQTIDLNNIAQGEFDLGSKPVVVVEELLPTSQVSSEIVLKYFNNSYKLYIRNKAQVSQKVFIFGEPNNEQVTQKAGLVIYKNNSDGIAFDSRLKYLEIIGEVQNNAVLDINKRYGIIKRMVTIESETTRNTGRRNGKYYYTVQRWIEDYGIQDGVLKIFDRQTANHSGFYIDRPAFETDKRHIVNYKPLLVDLTLLF